MLKDLTKFGGGIGKKNQREVQRLLFLPFGVRKNGVNRKKYFLLQKVVPQDLILDLQLFSHGEIFSFFSENNY